MGCASAKLGALEQHDEEADSRLLASLRVSYDEIFRLSLLPTANQDDSTHRGATRVPVNGVGNTAVVPSTNELVSSFGQESSICDAEPDETIIIFDWDGTFCPSAWATLSPRPHRDLELRKLSLKVMNLLSMAQALGKVVLVTSQSRPWVDASCDHLMPQVKESLRNISVMYAGEFMTDAENARAHQSVENAEANMRAMRAAVSDLHSRPEGKCWKNIVCVGGTRYESDAIRQVARTGPSNMVSSSCCRAKTIKLPQLQRLKDVSFQVSMVMRWLPRIVDCDHDVAIDFDDMSRSSQFSGCSC